MKNRRYGDLTPIWQKTHGTCHLCHDKVDLDTYGLALLFGPKTATVDHLLPRAFGGPDHPENLLPAHLGCNSSRGTQDVELARYRLAGTVRVPLSTGERVGLGAVVTGCGAILGGTLAATPDENGRRQFNTNGALIGGGIGLLLAIAALS